MVVLCPDPKGIRSIDLAAVVSQRTSMKNGCGGGSSGSGV